MVAPSPSVIGRPYPGAAPANHPRPCGVDCLLGHGIWSCWNGDAMRRTRTGRNRAQRRLARDRTRPRGPEDRRLNVRPGCRLVHRPRLRATGPVTPGVDVATYDMTMPRADRCADGAALGAASADSGQGSGVRGQGADGRHNDAGIAVNPGPGGTGERLSLDGDGGESAGQCSQWLVVADEVAAEATGAACTGCQVPPRAADGDSVAERARSRADREPGPGG